MYQILKMFVITTLCCAISYAEEPSHVNSWQNFNTRARHHHKRHHCSSSFHASSQPKQQIAPPGPPGPQGCPGLQGFPGTNLFAFANFFVASSTVVDVAFDPTLGLGLIPLSTGSATNIAQDLATNESIILIPGDYVIDFAMTINNIEDLLPAGAYAVGIVRRNLIQGQTAFQTVQTYAIQIPNESLGTAYSLVGEVFLTLGVGDRITLASFSNPLLELFGTPPSGIIPPTTDTPATLNIRLLNGA